MRRTKKEQSDGLKQKSCSVREPETQPAVLPPPSSALRYLPWAIVLLVIFLAALVRIRLLEVPLERDEGEYAYAGQLLLQGVPPYQEAYNMKFPGVYVAYAAIMAAFGQTIAGIHLGLLLLNAGTIVLVFLLGKRLFSAAAGVAAAATYALMSLGIGVNGPEAHATHFVNAAAVGATLLLLYATDTGSAAKHFLSGLLYGVAILMKQPGAVFAVFGGLYLLAGCRPKRGAWPASRRKLADVAVFMIGLAVPLALTALALWRARVFDRFWFWAITYAREYVSENSLWSQGSYFASSLRGVAGPNLPLWILAGVGLVMLWWKKRDRVSAAFASGFLIFSFIAVCPGWYFRGHYFVLMLPAIALLAGATVSPARGITWLLFAVVLGFSAAQQGSFLLRFSAADAYRLSYGQCPFAEAIQIGDYLRAHTQKNARIAVIGSEPEIYFYANRRSATGYIYTYGMMEPQPFALTMQDEMIRELENARPEYVVFINMQTSWAPLPNSVAKVVDWWNLYSAQNYVLTGVANIVSAYRTEYHWDHLESYPVSNISIFRRRSR